MLQVWLPQADKAQEIYNALRVETTRPKPDPVRLAFLIGQIVSLRSVLGLQVPELEESILLLRDLTGRDLEWWL